MPSEHGQIGLGSGTDETALISHSAPGTVTARGAGAGTEFYLATGDIYATQQLLGHADVSTTANVYVQGSPADLEAKLGKVYGE